MLEGTEKATGVLGAAMATFCLPWVFTPSSWLTAGIPLSGFKSKDANLGGKVH